LKGRLDAGYAIPDMIRDWHDGGKSKCCIAVWPYRLNSYPNLQLNDKNCKKIPLQSQEGMKNQNQIIAQGRQGAEKPKNRFDRAIARKTCQAVKLLLF